MKEAFASIPWFVIGMLAAASTVRKVTHAISVTAFGVCLLSLIAAGFLASMATNEITPVKYAVIIAYAAFYGIFGVIFAMLTARNTRREDNAEPRVRG